eukprot:scaffold1033_cov109-Skeletonema_dohrnii-CCMP3373.AAC.1
MPPPLFGQLVHVAPQNFVGRPNSEGGNGFVQKDHADGSFDIRYCMDGSLEKNVNRLRITSLNPLVTTARRTNGTDVARPSILAPSHQPQQRSSPLTQPPTPPTSPQGIKHIIIQSRGWSKYEPRPNPLLVHLRDGRSKPKGVQGVWNRIHHRNSIDKTLVICAMLFVPHGNDMRKGGTAHKVTITRCGGMVKAKRDSYKRVNRPDGLGFHYPKVPENLLRKKGEHYFENWEITGSKVSDKDGNPKFALVEWVADIFMKDLLDLCQELEAKLGKRIHVRGQWDNASPHTERLLLALIAELFGQYGWVWTTQPANSPLTNIMDAAIFPALAKMVSGLQGVLAGGRYLHCEVLWQLVKKAWDDYPLDRIARTFVHHSQVAAAIYACDGGDEFVQERNGLSFGVRKACRLDYGDEEDGGAAMDLTSIEPRERVARGVIVEEMQEGLDLEGEADKNTYDELAFIAGDVDDADYDNFDDETKARYDKFVEAWYKKQDEMATEQADAAAVV